MVNKKIEPQVGQSDKLHAALHIVNYTGAARSMLAKVTMLGFQSEVGAT